jgi:hypothetical protein
LPQELESAAARTVEHLQSRTAALTVERAEAAGGRLVIDLVVRNLSGHKFPTAYPSRRAWLHVTVRDRSDRVVFESGALGADGSIAGNDNDTAATRFEPHYTEITDPGQVQVYEDIMAGADGMPTTGLLAAVRFVKDNRLLPSGFDKRRVELEIAPQGRAVDDDDFTGGGDRIRYAVPLGGAQGPFSVTTELWFQPISFRWAANLKAYTAPEPQRFTRYYDAMSAGSAVVVARAAARVP